MNVIFLFPYPPGHSPSQRFRFEQYFENLSSAGFTYSLHSFWSAKTWCILYRRGHYFSKALGFLGGLCRRLTLFTKIHQADFIFIHRECTPIGPPVMEWLIAKIWRKKIIYDFDDAIWLPNTSSENRLVASIKWHAKVSIICSWSYKVSCGNLFLQNFAKKYAHQAIINPTTIETNYWHNPSLYSMAKSSELVTIGWTGTHSTIKYLDLLIGVLQKIELEFMNVRLVVIADKKPNLPLSRVTFIPWSKENEVKDLMQFDIGIMPLSDDIWAQGKCGFKALQYLALNIPALVSPVGINTSIIDHGSNGFLCDSSNEWFDYLSLLIKDSNLRTEMGMRGRQKIIDRYSVLSNSSNFLSLFE